jgi:hypothetical protein
MEIVKQSILGDTSLAMETIALESKPPDRKAPTGTSEIN